MAADIIHTIAEALGADPEGITEESYLDTEVFVSMLDRLTITDALDKRFNIEIPDRDQEKWERVEDVVETVERLCGEMA